MTVTAIANLIFSKALEKGGEPLGEAAYKKIDQMLNVIREKFRAEEVEGKLTKAEKDPSEKNKSRFGRELAELMEDDQAFAQKLKAMMDELKLDEQINPTSTTIGRDQININEIHGDSTRIGGS